MGKLTGKSWKIPWCFWWRREGAAGSALRNGLENQELRMEDMGIKPDTGRRRNDAETMNSRGLNGTARDVFLIAKARNQGSGNIINHGTVTGEVGLLG